MTQLKNRLLIVDDALIMRMKIRDIAQGCGWNVVAEARNGVEAMEMFTTHKPDLVTLDMVMPEIDGISVLREIRSAEQDSKVVMVSAVDQKEKLIECIELGALDFIVKPFSDDRLTELLNRYRTD